MAGDPGIHECDEARPPACRVARAAADDSSKRSEFLEADALLSWEGQGHDRPALKFQDHGVEQLVADLDIREGALVVVLSKRA